MIKEEEAPPELPIGNRAYLACRRCRLVLTEPQFLRSGCPICATGPIAREELLDMTTAGFSNFVGLIAPEKSWVARLIGRTDCPNGVFAAALEDEDEDYDDGEGEGEGEGEDEGEEELEEEPMGDGKPSVMTDEELFAKLNE